MHRGVQSENIPSQVARATVWTVGEFRRSKTKTSRGAVLSCPACHCYVQSTPGILIPLSTSLFASMPKDRSLRPESYVLSLSMHCIGADLIDHGKGGSHVRWLRRGEALRTVIGRTKEQHRSLSSFWKRTFGLTLNREHFILSGCACLINITCCSWLCRLTPEGKSSAEKKRSEREVEGVITGVHKNNPLLVVILP